MFRKKKVIVWEKEETPPEPPVDPEAVDVVWSDDRKAFCEILCEDGIYKYCASMLDYDEDYLGYYWTILRDPFAGFFDSLEKAESEARAFLRLQGYAVL